MNYQQVRQNITGPMQVLPTIFDADNKIDNGATKEVMEFMIDGGLKTGTSSLLIQGAVGQFYTLTYEERMEHAQWCVGVSDGRLPIVVGCQEIGTDNVIELVKHAAAIGADAVQISPPHYYFANQLNQDDVFKFVQEVANAADIAIVMYNNWWSSVGVTPETLVRLTEEIPAVVGTKWRGRDLYDNLRGYKMAADKLTMIENDYWFSLTASHQLGARGYVTYLGTFWPEYDLEVWRLMEDKKYFEAGEKLLSLGVPLMEMSMKVSGDHSNIMAELLKLAGLPTWTPRRPTPPLPDHAKREIREIAERAGMPIKQAKSA